MMDKDTLAYQRDDLLHQVMASIFYHSRRARFLDSLNRLLGAATLVLNFGSVLALVTSLVATVSIGISQIVPLCVAAFTALVRALSLHYRIDDAIRADENAADQLRLLQRAMERAGDYGEDTLREFWERVDSIPSPRYTLELLHHISYNRAVDALGLYPQSRIPGIPEKLWFWQRFTAPLFDLPPKPKLTRPQNAESQIPTRT